MVVKGKNIPNEWIDKMCESLDLSIDEAVEMYLADNGIVENAEQTALHEKAKSVKISHGAESIKERKKTERKREPNEAKRAVILALVNALDTLADIENATITNWEKYIDFNIGDRSFTINLVEHRKKKK